MLRGIHHSTALTPHHQSLTILSEGTRISRKCSRLKKFLSAFSSFAIDFVMQHSSVHHHLTLRHRFLRVIARAAADHFRVWRLPTNLLWRRFIDTVLQRVWGEGYHPLLKRIIKLTFQNSVGRESRNELPPKRRKLNPTNAHLCLLPSEKMLSPPRLPAPTVSDNEDDNVEDEDSKMSVVPLEELATTQ